MMSLEQENCLPPAKRRRLWLSQDLVHAVPTLKEITVDFVASNLSLVESFIGFPDIVGEEIFRTAELKSQFLLSEKQNINSMKLFTESYGELILSCLNLSGCHLGLNFALDNILLFGDLEELDVSSCGLGDGHELLAYMGHLSSLRKLNLSSNCLSDEGIRRLTTPYRIFGRGPGHLQMLDLSDNPEVSSKGIGRLSSFCNLHTVDVTKTKVRLDPDLKRKWNFKPLKSDCLIEITNKGWASDVVKGWMKFAEDKANTSKERTSNEKFYSKSRRKEEVVVKAAGMTSQPGYRLLLVRAVPDKTSSLKSTSFIHSANEDSASLVPGIHTFKKSLNRDDRRKSSCIEDEANFSVDSVFDEKLMNDYFVMENQAMCGDSARENNSAGNMSLKRRTSRNNINIFNKKFVSSEVKSNHDFIHQNQRVLVQKLIHDF